MEKRGFYEMGKVAFVFPGQGSQFVGMGKDLIEQSGKAHAYFKKADERLGIDLTETILNGPEDKLTRTENAQPALLTMSVALQFLLQDEGIIPDYAAGHSLGEYSALVAAGSMTFEDAVYAVRHRGLLMDEAVPDGQGAMAAILGLNAEELETVCRTVSETGHIVQLANLNSSNQIVISGKASGVEKASELAKEAGAKRVIELKVSGPFHSELMRPAAAKFQAILDATAIRDSSIPIVANVTADTVSDAEDIQDLLIQQLYSPVRWVESVHKLIDLGVTTFVEIGPGKVLSGLIKKISRATITHSVGDLESLQGVVQHLKGSDA